MDRRALLRAALIAPLAASPLRLYAAAGSSARLLLVFLRGGYDSASFLVPIGSPYYYEARPGIAVMRPGSGADAALQLTSDWAIHPAVRESLLPLYNKGELAFIPFAGIDDLSRSHFETQERIELAQSSSGTRDYSSGFLNRLAGVSSAAAKAVAFTDQLPTILRGKIQAANVSLRNFSAGKPALNAAQTEAILEMYKGSPLGAAVAESFRVRDTVLQQIASEPNAMRAGSLTARGFELEARRIAVLMRDNFNLAVVDVGGWDTHAGQGGGTGYLAGRFDELGRGIAAYAKEMGPAWKSTVVVVISEFGRTFRENGNGGTDHGHATVYWVLGGAVRGGRVAGEQVGLSEKTLHESRDYPLLNEYRAVLSGLFARVYGLSAAQLQDIFPGVKPKDLGLV